MSGENKPATERTTGMRWEFAPDIPTTDFLECGSLDDVWKVQEAVEDFVYWLERDRFLTWEAVICEEQGIALTPDQNKALGGLLNFSNDAGKQILYIDDLPRPSEPWHVILNKIAPYLLVELYRTSDCQQEVQCDGWALIQTALREHGRALSLPSGVESVEKVVSAELRHKLWLQFCFNDLSGLGQLEGLTLEDPEEHYRIEWFIQHLRECKESVSYFDLTIDTLLTMVLLPARDLPIFLKIMLDGFGLASAQEPIASRL